MVILDIGFNPKAACLSRSSRTIPDLKPGDEVEVLLEHLEIRKAPSFSRRRKPTSCACGSASASRTRTIRRSKARRQEIKGGVVVDLMGVDAFLPGSQIALRRVPNIDELSGRNSSSRSSS